MVLAEKPPTWVPVMYDRLKHLMINVDAFREKVRMGHYPQIGGKGKKGNQKRGKQLGGTKVVKEDTIVARATTVQGHKEAI